MLHSAVSDHQRNHAKDLRRAMTRAETLLWRYIKAHRIEGLGFRRQVPTGRYIVDFVCHDARIVVELDGETHDFQQQQKRDHARDAWVASRGYVVLRFTSRDVLSNLEGVVTVIRETAKARQDAPPSLSLPQHQRVYARLRRAMGGGNPQTEISRVARSSRGRREPPP